MISLMISLNFSVKGGRGGDVLVVYVGKGRTEGKSKMVMVGSIFKSPSVSARWMDDVERARVDR